MGRKRRTGARVHPPSCSLAHEEDGSPSMDGIEAHIEAEIRPMVAARGFAVQDISTGDMRTGFSYTIGLTDMGHPELLVKGFHPVMASGLLAYVAGHVREHCQAGDLVGQTRLALPVGPEGAAVAFWLLAPTPKQDEGEGPGLAKAYYRRWVPHLRVKPAGWPCERCTLYRERARCTCKFMCTWHACAVPGDRVPIEEVAPGQYRIATGEHESA